MAKIKKAGGPKHDATLVSIMKAIRSLSLDIIC